MFTIQTPFIKAMEYFETKYQAYLQEQEHPKSTPQYWFPFITDVEGLLARPGIPEDIMKDVGTYYHSLL